MKRTNRLWALMLASILCFLPLSGLAARYGEVVRITNPNAVNVRKGPGTGYGVIGEAQPDNVYPYLGTENGWHCILFTGQTTGYVSGSRTTIEYGLVSDDVGGGERVEAVVRVTHYNALNVRKGPGKKYGVIGEAKPGTTWTYLGTDDGWNIIDYDGETGYIAANRTEVEEVDVITEPTTPGGIRCDECDGSGLCPACDGDGMASIGNRKIDAVCHTCDGSGDCLQCGGYGFY